MAMKFVTAVKKYFGLLPNQKTMEFAGEINELTQEDRNELAVMLSEELGEEVEPGEAKKK